MSRTATVWARPRWHAVLAVALLAAAGGGALAAPTPRPSLRLAPDPIGLEELALLEIKVDGVDLNTHFDASFQLDNLRLARGPSNSTSVQIVNGVPSTSRSLSWFVQPIEVGLARVRAISVQIGDQEISLRDASITVQEEMPSGRRRQASRGSPFDSLFSDDPFERLRSRRPRPQQPREPPKIFLRAEVSPRRPYVGQQTLYTLYLYTQVDIHSVNPDRMPDFKGFWAREIPHEEQLQPEMIEEDGDTLGRVVLLQRALFPRREGTLSIEPTTARLLARVPDRGPFGPIFSRTTELERTSNAVEVAVQPLPPAPAGFRGAVGRLRLEGQLEPRDLAVGEAATLTLTLRGAGHLQGVPEPQLPELPGIKVFPPQQQARERLERTTVVGTRIWSFVLVPERPGTWELPPIEVPYFDPRAERYQTAAAEGLVLNARGATSLPQLDGETVSLHPIRTAALPAAQAGWGLRGLRPLLFGLPWAIGALVLLIRRGGVGGRHRPLRQALLRRLDAAVAEDEPRRAAACIEDAWRDFLHQRWEIPRGTASTQWRRQLVERGARQTAAENLVKLADDLHYLRYAPKLSSTDELRLEMIERSRKLARALG